MRSDLRDWPKLATGLICPALCPECLLIARRAKRHKGLSWEYERTNAFRGLLAVLEQTKRQEVHA